LAPERFQRSGHAGAISYALGCLAYLYSPACTLCRIGTCHAAAKAPRDQPKALTELNPAISPFIWEEALFKALAKQPNERYSSIQRFLER